MRYILSNLALLLFIITDLLCEKTKITHIYCKKNEIIDMDISDFYFNFNGLDQNQNSLYSQSYVSLKKPINKICGDTEKHKGLIGTMKFTRRDNINFGYYENEFFYEQKFVKSASNQWNIEKYSYDIKNLNQIKIQAKIERYQVGNNPFSCEFVRSWNTYFCQVKKRSATSTKENKIYIIYQYAINQENGLTKNLGKVASQQNDINFSRWKMLVHSIYDNQELQIFIYESKGINLGQYSIIKETLQTTKKFKTLKFQILRLIKISNKYLFFEAVNPTYQMNRYHILYCKIAMGEKIVVERMDIKFQSFGKFLNSYSELSTKSQIVELLDTQIDPINKLQSRHFKYGPVILTIYRSSVNIENEEWVPYFQNYNIGLVDPLVSAAAQLDKHSKSYEKIKMLLKEEEKKQQYYYPTLFRVSTVLYFVQVSNVIYKTNSEIKATLDGKQDAKPGHIYTILLEYSPKNYTYKLFKEVIVSSSTKNLVFHVMSIPGKDAVFIKTTQNTFIVSFQNASIRIDHSDQKISQIERTFKKKQE